MSWVKFLECLLFGSYLVRPHGVRLQTEVDPLSVLIISRQKKADIFTKPREAPVPFLTVP